MFPLDLKYFGVISNSLAFHHGQSNIHSSENCNNNTLYSANVDLSDYSFIYQKSATTAQSIWKLLNCSFTGNQIFISWKPVSSAAHWIDSDNSNTVCFSPHKCINYILIKYICINYIRINSHVCFLHICTKTRICVHKCITNVHKCSQCAQM